MRRLFAAAIALALIGGIGAGEAAAARKKGMKRDYGSRPASEKTHPRRPMQDFDETQYYERLSERIPFGSPAWWRQKQLENLAP